MQPLLLLLDATRITEKAGNISVSALEMKYAPQKWGWHVLVYLFAHSWGETEILMELK